MKKAGFKRMAEFEGWPEGHSNVILCKTVSGLENYTSDVRWGSKSAVLILHRSLPVDPDKQTF
jgi:hypothetical protein